MERDAEKNESDHIFEIFNDVESSDSLKNLRKRTLKINQHCDLEIQFNNDFGMSLIKNWSNLMPNNTLQEAVEKLRNKMNNEESALFKDQKRENWETKCKITREHCSSVIESLMHKTSQKTGIFSRIVGKCDSLSYIYFEILMEMKEMERALWCFQIQQEEALFGHKDFFSWFNEEQQKMEMNFITLLKHYEEKIISGKHKMAKLSRSHGTLQMKYNNLINYIKNIKGNPKNFCDIERKNMESDGESLFDSTQDVDNLHYVENQKIDKSIGECNSDSNHENYRSENNQDSFLDRETSDRCGGHDRNEKENGVSTSLIGYEVDNQEVLSDDLDHDKTSIELCSSDMFLKSSGENIPDVLNDEYDKITRHESIDFVDNAKEEAVQSTLDNNLSKIITQHDDNQGLITMTDIMKKGVDMGGYKELLNQFAIFFCDGGIIDSELKWLNEDYIDRDTIPPSQDSFRDGTNFQFCLYEESHFMIQLQNALKLYHDAEKCGKLISNQKKKSILSRILKKNKQIYEMKKKLDAGRHALLKKLKLQWAMCNSKWNGFPLLKRGYRLLNLLGKGGFAEVWEAFDPIELKLYAAKLHILSQDMNQNERARVVQRVKQEIDIHRICRTHNNIVNMKACFEMGDDMLATILYLCNDGDLDHYIKTYGPVTEKLSQLWIKQILEGLLHMKNLREGRVHHCDLKPGNILRDGSIVKIADFGLSEMVSKDQGEVLWNGGGTLWYQPPECLMRDKVYLSDKIDVWAVGCILFEMLFMNRPFGIGCKAVRSDTIPSLLREMRNGIEFQQEISVSRNCKEFISYLLTYDWHERPSIESALSHPYIREICD